jgi:hypothetical protein
VLRDPDGTRESEQISGTINPGTGAVRGRHDITVTSAPPVGDPDDPHPSPWSGASGAGVFCEGLLTAVLVVDAKGFGHGRGLLKHGQGGAAHPHRLGQRCDVGRVAGEHGDDGARSDTGIRKCACHFPRLLVHLAPAAPDRGVQGTGDQPAGAGCGVAVHLVGECAHTAVSFKQATSMRRYRLALMLLDLIRLESTRWASFGWLSSMLESPLMV